MFSKPLYCVSFQLPSLMAPPKIAATLKEDASPEGAAVSAAAVLSPSAAAAVESAGAYVAAAVVSLAPPPQAVSAVTDIAIANIIAVIFLIVPLLLNRLFI